MSLVFSVAMPICTFFGFIFFLIRYQIEKYNFCFVYHQTSESIYLLEHIAKLQVAVVLFFQFVNFMQIIHLMGDDAISYFHWFFCGLQIFTIIVAYIAQKKYPKQYDDWINRYLLFTS